jgi:hypothetical protein
MFESNPNPIHFKNEKRAATGSSLLLGLDESSIMNLKKLKTRCKMDPKK